MTTIKIGIGMVIMIASFLAGIIFNNFGSMGYPLIILVFGTAFVLVTLLSWLNYLMVRQDKNKD